MPASAEPRLTTVAGRDVWHIYHDRKRISTGVPLSEGASGRARAEQELARYKADLAGAERSAGATIGGILPLYLQNRRDKGIPGAERLAWAHKPLMRHLASVVADDLRDSDISEYLKKRDAEGVKRSTARTELEALRAALRWAGTRKAGKLVEFNPEIDMPARPAARDRWLTRDEAAALLAACSARHVRLFVLLALHTASRRSRILGLTWDRVNLETRLIDYRQPGEVASRKRAVPVPINDDLVAELAEAKARAATGHVIEWSGGPVDSIKHGFNNACDRAGLPGVTPHTLRHTAVTWMMQAGVPAWRVAGMAGMTTEMVEKTYGHHHPDYLKDAADALAGRPSQGAVFS